MSPMISVTLLGAIFVFHSICEDRFVPTIAWMRLCVPRHREGAMVRAFASRPNKTRPVDRSFDEARCLEVKTHLSQGSPGCSAGRETLCVDGHFLR